MDIEALKERLARDKSELRSRQAHFERMESSRQVSEKILGVKHAYSKGYYTGMADAIERVLEELAHETNCVA